MLNEVGEVCSVICLSLLLLVILAVYAALTIIFGSKPVKRKTAMEKRESIVSNGIMAIGILAGITFMFLMSLEPYSAYSGFSTNYSEENTALLLIILLLSIAIVGLATLQALNKYPYKPKKRPIRKA